MHSALEAPAAEIRHSLTVVGLDFKTGGDAADKSPMSESSNRSRDAVILAMLLSMGCGAVAVGWEHWWIDFDEGRTVFLLSILTAVLFGLLAVVAPISVGLSAARRIRRGLRPAAKSSGSLALAFVLPAALLAAGSGAWNYVVTPSMRAELLQEYTATQLEILIAASPSPAVVAVTILGLWLAASLAVWVCILGITLAVGQVADRELQTAPRLGDDKAGL